ncbi:hypothetical protein skT53_04030 [Effusibacillus dendaii]|uniref:Undecaprenyl-diphosphatase n=1 Tax=Effusibacillus dendaii TaxID=2743772 RepID=A0A7I8D5J3_9BACL|nr:hypothetical protein skT53_04030 [Effusibacillus dendaii]
MLQGAKLVEGEVTETVQLLPLAVGALVAALAGYLAVKWMLALLQRGSLKGFAIYVWVLGLGIIVAQLLGYW